MPVVRYLVSGHVQGVGFRAATRAQALRLRLDGHASNLADGRVEVLAAGPDTALAALETWLQRGPPATRVDAVQREDCDTPVPAGFVIR